MGATWTTVATVDLRGTSPQTASGGAAGVATDFVDNQFDIFNVTDSTKVLDFDVSPVATGTTRTISMADANVDLADIATNTTAVGLNTTHRGSDGTDHSYIDQSIATDASPVFTGLKLSTIGSLPSPAIAGELIRLITDNRMYFGLET